jgi:hypothetical protein
LNQSNISQSYFRDEQYKMKTSEVRSSEDESSPVDEDDSFINHESNEDPLTSDYAEELGSEDESFQTHEQLENDESVDSHNPEELTMYIVTKPLLERHKGPKIVKIIKEEHGISISYCTLG